MTEGLIDRLRANFRIIELEGGNFAVQKKRCGGWGFCSLTEDYVWVTDTGIQEYCIASSLQEAEMAIDKIRMDREMKKNKPTVLRVVKRYRL